MNVCSHKWDEETCLFCKLERERDEARASDAESVALYRRARGRAEKAGADAARLREALRETVELLEDALPAAGKTRSLCVPLLSCGQCTFCKGAAVVAKARAALGEGTP